MSQLNDLDMKYKMALFDKMDARACQSGLPTTEAAIVGITHTLVEELATLTALVSDLLAKQTLLELRIEALSKKN